MARFGLDYAFGRLSAAQHKAIGSSFAVRYLSPDANKNLTKAEAEALRNGGVDVVVVWESGATRATQGRDAGEADAREAAAQAAACGMPAGRPIYFAVDEDINANLGALDAYFAGVDAVLRHWGPYGSADVCDHLAARGATHCYQTYAWSAGRVSSHAVLYQYSNNHSIAGVGVDYDRALKDDFGQWGYAPPAPKNPQGTWAANITVQMPEGKWHIESLHGTNVHMGQHNRRWRAEVSVGEEHGDWEIRPMEFS